MEIKKKGKNEYTSIFNARRNKKIKAVYSCLDSNVFIDKTFIFNKRLLDFGSGVESKTYHKTTRDGGQYHGWDIDVSSEKWLTDNGVFTDFWTTSNKFDIIVASQVYEHLDHDEREQFIERAYNILEEGGVLIMDFPYVKNIGGLTYWEDRTHLFPPDPIDDSSLLEQYGFKSSIYLVGISYYPPYYFFRILLNFLLGFYPHHTSVVVCKK
jgi:SAM-dependent methyltransferase